MIKESALTKLQKESIKINKFIFHIISKEYDEPIYLDEITLTTEQKKFFKDRIAEVAEGTQYTFKTKEFNTLLKLCKKLNIDNTTFIHTSKEICSNFKSYHKGGMSDGSFIISIFDMINKDDSVTSLIALIKMDHKKVLEYTYSDDENNRQVQLREIAKSFIESKEAMQKVAIIDIYDEFQWDILAKERGKSEGITDYFESFLNALKKDTPSSLTIKTVKEVSKWARINNDKLKEIPELNNKTSDFSSYAKTRAIDFLKSNDGITFNCDNFYSHILYNETYSQDSQSKIYDLEKDLKDHFVEIGIEGQVFVSRPNSIPSTVLKTKKITEEGVVIEWQGNAADNGILIEEINNQKVITITTSNLETIEK
jgi:hypothetical protein